MLIQQGLVCDLAVAVVVQDIVALLVPLLSRPHVDVVLMTCQMLQKLSVVQVGQQSACLLFPGLFCSYITFKIFF